MSSGYGVRKKIGWEGDCDETNGGMGAEEGGIQLGFSVVADFGWVLSIPPRCGGLTFSLSSYR